MTWRCVWGEPFPQWADHATEEAAHRHALRVSRAEGVEVAVVEIAGMPIPGAVGGSEPLWGGSTGEGRRTSVRGVESDERAGER